MTRHGRGARSLNGSGEYRAWMAAITGVCALGAVAAVVPVVEHNVGAALLAAVLTAVAVAVIRRELRIRRRLAAIGPTPARKIAGRRRPTRLSIEPAASAAPRTGGTA